MSRTSQLSEDVNDELRTGFEKSHSNIQEDLRSLPRVAKQGRKRSGCMNCRRKHKKCDEAKPVCSKCLPRGETCEWDTGFTFRHTSIDTDHPSMKRSKTAHPVATIKFQSANISPEDSRTAFPTPTAESHVPSVDAEPKALGPAHDPGTPPVVASSSRNPTVVSPLLPHGTQDYTLAEQTPSPILHVPTDDILTSVSTTVANPGLHPASNHASTDFSSGAMDTTDLELLDYLTSRQADISFLNQAGTQSSMMSSESWHTNNEPTELPQVRLLQGNSLAESPDMYANYYPNTRYKELHSTLHHHMVETARNTTRPGSASPVPDQNYPPSKDPPIQLAGLQDSSTSSVPLQNLPRAKISLSRQLSLWNNYLQEIATWLDMFDCERHFQTTIPILAKTADHLHYSILALSARQLERMNPDHPYTESLFLYQEAIRSIVEELHTLDVAVIASCVLLCVLEMMSSSPKAWSRHLEGCAMLLTAAGINGNAGDAKQAIFWCFARMDCWGSFLGDVPTKIPTSLWFVPSPKMSFAVNHFKTTSGCDSYANYAVFLCASVVGVMSIKYTASTSSYSARWRVLFRLLEDWYENRPPAMCPLFSYSQASADDQQVFPSVLYANPGAINGNQLYHASALLMLQERPKDMQSTKSHRSILWHARQICGIAISNRHHGAWINALQPLWIAGRIMSHSSEHSAILELLASIESESGWATAWRMQDLKEYWGLEDET